MISDRLSDPAFGELAWDAKLRIWRGRSKMTDGTPFDMLVYSIAHFTQVPSKNDADWDRGFGQESRDALARVQCSDTMFRDAIVKEFLPIYLRWPEADQIDETTFKKRLQLESVIFYSNGMAEVIYDDNGMFGGHALLATMDPDGGVRHVELFG
jgi:hypothetical protein